MQKEIARLAGEAVAPEFVRPALSKVIIEGDKNLAQDYYKKLHGLVTSDWRELLEDRLLTSSPDVIERLRNHLGIDGALIIDSQDQTESTIDCADDFTTLSHSRENVEVSTRCPIITVSDLESFLDESGLRRYLEPAFVGRISICGNTTILKISNDEQIPGLPRGHYHVSTQLLLDHISVYPKDRQIIESVAHKGSSIANWRNEDNLPFKGLFYPVPIFVTDYEFSQQGLDQLEYLQNFPSKTFNEKLLLHQLGTVAHEIGHNVFAYIVIENEELIVGWKLLIDKYGSITDYAKKYDQGNKFDYDENLAEAFRLYFTCPEHLFKRFPEIAEFIEKLDKYCA